MPYADEDEHREYQRIWANERRKKRRRLLAKILGDKCERCGAKDTLQAHHRIKENKSFKLFSGRGTSCSLDRWLKEVGKCTLLCATCHSRIHADEWRISEQCLVDECENKHRSRGLCSTHYNQVYWRKTHTLEQLGVEYLEAQC